ncbi:MAG: hypothetical protein ACK5JU_11005 [Bacteroidales bacterium]
MNKSQKIIDITQKKKERDNSFAILVYGELMMELSAGDVDPKTVYEILTERGKFSVSQRMCN